MQKLLYFLGGILTASAVIFYFGIGQKPAPPLGQTRFYGDIIFELKEIGSSGESGRVGLTFMGDKTNASLDLTGAPYGELQPAFINKGTCGGLGDIFQKLIFPASGSSNTKLEIGLAELRVNLPLAINVRKSLSDDKTIVSCGEMEFN